MLTRALLATLLLAAAPLATPLGTANAAPRHHHAARVSIATYRTSTAHKPHPDLRAHRTHATRTRLATTQRHHPLSRGS